MLGFTTLLGELELDKKSERQREANMDRREKGQLNTGRATPFGYRREKVIEDNDVKVAFHLIPEAGEAIAWAAGALLSGSSLRSVCREWTRRGLKPPAADRWWPTTVARVLNNPIYAGVAIYDGKEYVGGKWEYPIDPDTWRAVTELLGRKGRNTGRGVKTLLGGIAMCPCGAPMLGAKSAGREAYRCRVPGAGHVTRSHREGIDHLVTEVVIARLSRPDAVDLVKSDDSGAVEELRSKARAHRARIEEIEASMADPDNAEVLSSLVAALKATKKKLADVETELAETATTSPLSAVVGAEDVRAAWGRLDIDRQREVVRILVDVTLLPAGRGRAAMEFRPESVVIKWK